MNMNLLKEKEYAIVRSPSEAKKMLELIENDIHSDIMISSSKCLNVPSVECIIVMYFTKYYKSTSNSER